MAPSHLRWPLVLSIGAAVVTIGMKGTAYAVTGSVGLFSDALESGVNLFAAVVAYLSLLYAARPADPSHAYGHEKIEYLSSGLEGALILAAGLGTAGYAIRRLIYPEPLAHLEIGTVIALAASAVNLCVARVLLHYGRKHRSIVLEADGKHLMSDVWTSVGVVAGIGLVLLTGRLELDAIIAVGVGLNIMWTGGHLIHRSFDGLMDHALPDAEQEQIRAVIAAKLGIPAPPVADQVEARPVEARHPAAGKVTADELDAPAITGKNTAAPYTLVRLKAANLPKGAAALWSIFPRKGADVAATPADRLEFTAPPGVYEVELTVISSAAAGLDARRFYETVTIGEGKAPPANPPATPPAAGWKLDPVAALGRIQFGSSSCTATVIGPRRADGRADVLTASHCMSGVGARGTLTTKDGRKLAVRVVVHQKRPDLAWLVTDEPAEGLAFAELAAENPAAGVRMFHQGYGIDRPGNREDGTVTNPENGDGQTQFRVSVSPGDSGGGMLRADTLEVISTVCCTTRLAGTGDVWGASVRSIRAARPGAVNLDQLPEPADNSGPAPECCGAFLDQLRRLFAR